MSEAPRIILLHEIIESKVKKENELAFYQKELENNSVQTDEDSV